MPKIICAQCKSIEDVDEKPPATETILCSECKSYQRSTAGGERTRKRRPTVPRKKHGTRVMLPITCAECGETDTLDYVPKGADLDDVLCSECAREQFGTDSAWARVERRKKEEAKQREWKFECDECGRTDYLPFEPKPERHYECNLCRMDHDTPSPERLAGKRKAAGGVFIRRSTEPEDS